MPSLLNIQNQDKTPTIIKEYIKKLNVKTDRNVIVYYSGWLSAPWGVDVGINYMDKNGFMAMIESLDLNCGLDLILHTNQNRKFLDFKYS